jgi:hypothetical protein
MKCHCERIKAQEGLMTAIKRLDSSLMAKTIANVSFSRYLALKEVSGLSAVMGNLNQKRLIFNQSIDTSIVLLP